MICLIDRQDCARWSNYDCIFGVTRKGEDVGAWLVILFYFIHISIAHGSELVCNYTILVKVWLELFSRRRGNSSENNKVTKTRTHERKKRKKNIVHTIA